MNPRDAGYFGVGLAFLMMAKAKHLMSGYTSPKPFDMTQTDRCVAYDRKVVEEWLAELERYTGATAELRGQNVLELGPGSDLGAGLILLALGAASYSACDVNDLAARTPAAFYEALFASLTVDGRAAQIPALREALRALHAGEPSRLNYVVRDDFDIAAAFGEASIDQVFSQAAFEHFDDIDAVVAQLTRVCRPGARIVAEIDLKTHSRWIRDRDPNNIYRYPDSLYRAFWFRGIPNRVRPQQYRAAFERHGWSDIAIRPLAQLTAAHPSPGSVSRRFRGENNEMSQLSIAFCARKVG